ncbi:MAG: tripartite tricarboxylate transporter substrate binding protein [Burkholderiales bacterium]|nr:tripartite tricarboxylate transporter substrate binding protein [Burkholderiales bacterium]
MHASNWTRAALASLCAALAGLAANVGAQAPYPSKPITYVVPFAPGGNTDTLARLLGKELAASLGQPVVVENKPGAGGNIGSDFVAKAAPDGYTILGGTISSHSINPSVYPKMPYDAVKSFEPIVMIGRSPLVLVVGAGTPYKTFADLVAAAKAKPGSISFATPGSGTSPHMAAELLKGIVGIDLTHVPYKGSGPAVGDVVAGHVPMMFDTLLVVGQQIKAGKLRPLLVAAPKRLAALPDVPTAAELGVKGFEVASWQAVFAPAGTPKPIVQKLNAEFAKAMKTPAIQERLAQLAVEPDGGSPESLAEYQKAEIAKWAKVVKEARIKVD